MKLSYFQICIPVWLGHVIKMKSEFWIIGHQNFVLRLPCWWYSKVVPWDADRSWKGIDLIQSLSNEKTSKTCQIIGNFQQLSNQTKIRIFWHVLDVFSVLSDRIKSIPFHERSASHGTTLEYHQQGNRSNLKIHFLMAQSDFQGPTPVGRKVQIFPKTHFFTYLYPYTPKFWSPIIQNSLFIFMTCPSAPYPYKSYDGLINAIKEYKSLYLSNGLNVKFVPFEEK